MPVWAALLSLHRCQSVNPRALQRAACAGAALAATEIRPPLGTEPRAVVMICLVGTEHALLCVCDRESVQHRLGLCSHFPASRAPRLRCALPPPRSLIRAINPGGLSPFVCWRLFFFFLSLEFSALFLPSLLFFVCLFAWQWHLGFAWLFFLYLCSLLT